MSVWWPRRTLPSSVRVTGTPVVVRSSRLCARLGRFSASRTWRSLCRAVRMRPSPYQSLARWGWRSIRGGTKSDGYARCSVSRTVSVKAFRGSWGAGVAAGAGVVVAGAGAVVMVAGAGGRWSGTNPSARTWPPRCTGSWRVRYHGTGGSASGFGPVAPGVRLSQPARRRASWVEYQSRLTTRTGRAAKARLTGLAHHQGALHPVQRHRVVADAAGHLAGGVGAEVVAAARAEVGTDQGAALEAYVGLGADEGVVGPGRDLDAETGVADVGALVLVRGLGEVADLRLDRLRDQGGPVRDRPLDDQMAERVLPAAPGQLGSADGSGEPSEETEQPPGPYVGDQRAVGRTSGAHAGDGERHVLRRVCQVEGGRVGDPGFGAVREGERLRGALRPLEGHGEVVRQPPAQPVPHGESRGVHLAALPAGRGGGRGAGPGGRRGGGIRGLGDPLDAHPVVDVVQMQVGSLPGPVLALVVRLGALGVVGPTGPAQRDTDLQHPVERRPHAQRGGDPAADTDAAPAARTRLASPHGVQPDGRAADLAEPLPAVVRDGLDDHLVADPGLLPADEAGAARGGERAGLVLQQAQQLRLVELGAELLGQLVEDLLRHLLGRAQGDHAQAVEKPGPRRPRGPRGRAGGAVVRIGVRADQHGGQPTAVVEGDGARGGARRPGVLAGQQPCRALPLQLGLQRYGVAPVRGLLGRAVQVGDPAQAPQPLAEDVEAGRVRGDRGGDGRRSRGGSGGGQGRGGDQGVEVVGAVVGHVQGAGPAARVERGDGGARRGRPVGPDEPQLDVEGVRQRERERVGEGRGPQGREFGRREDQPFGAEPPRVGGGGGHVGEVGVSAVLQDLPPSACVPAGDDRLFDAVPALPDPLPRLRVPHPGQGGHPEVVHDGEHRVGGGLYIRGEQFGAGEPVAEQAAESGDVPRGPGGRNGPGARGVEERPEEAVPVGPGGQSAEGLAVRADGVREARRPGVLAGQLHVLRDALRAGGRRRVRAGLGVDEDGVVVAGAEAEQWFAGRAFVGADDLVEDRFVECGRGVPEHVRAVHDGHVLGPHLIDQRLVLRMRNPRTVRGRHIEQIMVSGDGSTATLVIESENDPFVHGELAVGLVPGHLPGQLMELRRPLVEPRDHPVPRLHRNRTLIRQHRLEITDQTDIIRIGAQQDINVIDCLRLDVLRLRHRPRIQPLRRRRIRRPYIHHHIPVPRHITELVEILLRNAVRVPGRVGVDLSWLELLRPGEDGVVAVGAEAEQRFSGGALMGANDLVEDRFVECCRRVPEHVRAVHDGHVLGPHLIDQRLVRRMRNPRTVRGRHIEQIMIPGDRTPLTFAVESENDPFVHGELAVGLVPGHLPGQLMELRRPLVEPRDHPVPRLHRNRTLIRQHRLEITDQTDIIRIGAQQDINLVDRLRLDVLRLRHRPRIQPLRRRRIRRPYIHHHIPVPRHITELVEILLRNAVRVPGRVRVDDEGVHRERGRGRGSVGPRRVLPAGRGRRGRRLRVVQAAGQLGGVVGAEAQFGQRQRGVGQRPGDLRGACVGEAEHVGLRDEGVRGQFGRWRRQQGVERRRGGSTGPQSGGGFEERPVLPRGGTGGRVDVRAVGGGVPVGDHPVQQVRGHPAVAVPGGGARIVPAQAVHVGEGGQQLPVARLLFGVRAEGLAQGADLLEGSGTGEGVGRVRARVQSGVARQAVQVGPGGLRGEQPPTARPVRTFAEDRADMAVPVLRGARLRRRRVHRAPGPVRHVLGDRQSRDHRLLPGLAGEQHQRTVLVPFLGPGLEQFAELHTADLDGGVGGVVRPEGDGTGRAVANEVVGAPLGAEPGSGPAGR